MKRSKPLKFTKAPAAVQSDAKWTGEAGKNADSFLYPPMPGTFAPSRVKKMHVEILRDRYIQVFSASMGNHSLALFYCCWSQEQFDRALDVEFEAKLATARAQLADRASLIMMRGMGLVGEGSATVPPTVTAAMAKVVENMKNPDGTLGVQKKAYKLTVNGLVRPSAVPLQAVVAVRGPDGEGVVRVAGPGRRIGRPLGSKNKAQP